MGDTQDLGGQGVAIPLISGLKKPRQEEYQPGLHSKYQASKGHITRSVSKIMKQQKSSNQLKGPWRHVRHVGDIHTSLHFYLCVGNSMEDDSQKSACTDLDFGDYSGGSQGASLLLVWQCS